MSEIKFGTDGWRAITDKDFNYNNINKVINGISEYIFKESGYNKKILIGYDTRNKSDDFAFYIAEKFSDYGFETEISSKFIATPVLAYAALTKNAYAVMLTASHNPPEYLGIKFIPPYGGPAEDYMTNEIIRNLENIFIPKREKRVYKKVSFEEEYIKQTEKLIDFNAIKKSDLTVNYDGHHGAGANIFKYILDKYKIPNNMINIKRDINFGGHMPDPKEQYLPDLKALCKKNGFIGLSNDGDGDRFGVFDEKGTFISPNDIIAMLLKHLCINKKYTGKLAKTVGASSMLDNYALKNGIKVVETPVGFKWLGEVMRKDNIIIAGEESGGLSIKGHIPEKDGILANLLIMEMLAYSGKKLFEIHQEFLEELNRSFFNKRIDLKLSSNLEQENIINKFKSLKKIDKYKIIKTSQLDGLKLYLDDGSWVLVRKSGTEPLLRIYFETDKEEKSDYFANIIKQLC